MALSGKQKSYLRSHAHNLSPIIQVGKGSVTHNLVDTVTNALEARELIKLSVLQNCLNEPSEVAEAIANLSKAEIVQVIGRTIIMFKRSSNLKNRELSKNLPK